MNSEFVNQKALQRSNNNSRNYDAMRSKNGMPLRQQRGRGQYNAGMYNRNNQRPRSQNPNTRRQLGISPLNRIPNTNNPYGNNNNYQPPGVMLVKIFNFRILIDLFSSLEAIPLWADKDQ